MRKWRYYEDCNYIVYVTGYGESWKVTWIKAETDVRAYKTKKEAYDRFELIVETIGICKEREAQ